VALALVLSELANQTDVEVEALDLSAYDLPFPGTAPRDASSERFRESVKSATGVVLATPEYHGSFSSAIKLGIENLGFPSVLAGKPVSLHGVAAGQIGAIKSLEHLRSVCSHIGAIVLPSLVSVANVQQLFDKEGRCLDSSVEKRIRAVATTLLDYIHGAICPRLVLEAMVRGRSEEEPVL